MRKFQDGDQVRIEYSANTFLTGTVTHYINTINADFEVIELPFVVWDQPSVLFVAGVYNEAALELVFRAQPDLFEE